MRLSLSLNILRETPNKVYVASGGESNPKKLKETYVDRGYRGHGLTEPVKVWIAGAKYVVTVAIRKKLKRRNAVEPVIGHMKNDGRLLGAKLSQRHRRGCDECAAHNLRKILRRLVLLCAHFGVSLQQLLAEKMPSFQPGD